MSYAFSDLINIFEHNGKRFGCCTDDKFPLRDYVPVRRRLRVFSLHYPGKVEFSPSQASFPLYFTTRLLTCLHLIESSFERIQKMSRPSNPCEKLLSISECLPCMEIKSMYLLTKNLLTFKYGIALLQ